MDIDTSDSEALAIGLDNEEFKTKVRKDKSQKNSSFY